jgi:peroxin-16
MYKQATQKTGEVLSMPSQWLGMYSDFITKNSSAVTQIESALRSLTYIIPGLSALVSVFAHLANRNRPLPRV